MTLSNAIPAGENLPTRRSARERWWALQEHLIWCRRLMEKRNRAFAATVIRDFTAFIAGVKPVAGETIERARAAAAWLIRAQNATGCGGVSYGYFPLRSPRGWQAAYPETTGYIITSLLNYAGAFDDDIARLSALQMARWEISVQMPSGAVQGGILTPSEAQTPAAFNTGMVLDGLVSAAEIGSVV